MYSLSADNWTEIQRDLFALLAHGGNDLRDVQFELTNPLARVSSSKIRAVDYGYAAGKFFWDLDASSDTDRLNYYNRRLIDADMLDMADGFYWRDSEYDKSRWDEVVEELAADPSIGDAAMATDTDLALFTIRGGRLHMRVTSLHADAVWRLPYDVFTHTLLQEVMLADLRRSLSGLELGSYVHSSGAIWNAEQHNLLVKLASAEDVPSAAAMPPLGSPLDLDVAADAERILRERRFDYMPHIPANTGVQWLVDRLVEHRLRRDDELRPGVARATA